MRTRRGSGARRRCRGESLRRLRLPSFLELEELAEACEAISVVCPTDKHAEVALPLIRNGCHLLIEKPLCVSVEEAESMLGAAKESGSILQVGHIEHYNPVMAFLEEKVERPRYLTVERLAPFQPRGTEVGVVLDLMIHDIGIVMALIASPIRSGGRNRSAGAFADRGHCECPAGL